MSWRRGPRNQCSRMAFRVWRVCFDLMSQNDPAKMSAPASPLVEKPETAFAFQVSEGVPRIRETLAPAWCDSPSSSRSTKSGRVGA